MAVSILPRELKYTYGAFVVGGTSAPGNTRLPHGGYSIRTNFEKTEVMFSFVISQSSEANFETEATAVQAAFRIPRQAFTIVCGSTTLESFSHTGGTGFDAEPAIVNEVDDRFGSARSRKYDVQIVFKRPATNMSTNGRQSSLVRVDYDASNIRTLTIAGTYTASGSNSARTQFENNFATYVTAVQAAFSGVVWELIGKSETTPDTGTDDSTPAYKTLTFEARYREIIFSQVGASLNDSAVVGQSMDLSKSQSWPGDFPGKNVRRLISARAVWTANIDKSVTTNLLAKWNTVMPWVVSQAQAKLGLSAIAVSATPTFNHDKNTITATLDIQGLDGAGLLEYSITDRFESTTGVVLVGVASGNPYDKFLDLGPGSIRYTVEETAVEFGELDWFELDPLGTKAVAPPLGIPGFQGGEFRSVLIGRPQSSRRKETRGQPGYQFTVTVWSRVTVYELFTTYTGSTIGGGGGGIFTGA